MKIGMMEKDEKYLKLGSKVKKYLTWFC